jgi:hypothetical protein
MQPSAERIPLTRICVGHGSRGVTYKVAGKKYLMDQAATLLKFARATTNPDVAAGLLDKAADLSAKSEEARDASPQAPDVERPKR